MNMDRNPVRVSNRDPLAMALCRLLGMPLNVRSFELRAAVGEPMSVRCEYLPQRASPAADGEVIALTAVYEVVPRESTWRVQIEQQAAAALDEVRLSAGRGRRRIDWLYEHALLESFVTRSRHES